MSADVAWSVCSRSKGFQTRFINIALLLADCQTMLAEQVIVWTPALSTRGVPDLQLLKGIFHR